MAYCFALLGFSATTCIAPGPVQDPRGIAGTLPTAYEIRNSPLHGEMRGPAKDLADVDGDGVPELILGMPKVEYGEIQFSRIVCVSGSSPRVLWSHEGAIAGDRFGSSLDTGADLDGDGIEDLVGGAPSATLDGFEGVGMVRALSGRTGRVLWERFGPVPSANFGAAVTFCGDLDGDGVADVVVGAPGSSAGAPSGGEVVALSGRNGKVLWRSSLPIASGALGWSVVGFPDVQGDGVREVAAGLPNLGFDGRGGVAFLSGVSGRALRIVEGPLPFGALGRSLATWHTSAGPCLLAGAPFARNSSQEIVGAVVGVSFAGSPQVLHWGAEEGSEFGCALAAGDIDRDGIEDIAVGARFERDSRGVPSGCVRLYRSGLGFTETLIAAPTSGSQFGDGVSFTRSGALAVSAPLSSAPGAFVAGAVQILTDAGVLVREIHGINAGLELGRSVASVGDVDADGFEDFVVGAPFATDPDLFRRGEVRLYSGRLGELRWVVQGTHEFELLGTVVACAGDVDRDGIPDVAIGNPQGLDKNGVETGVVEIYSGRGGRLQRLVGLEPAEQFGSSLTLAGDVDGDGVGDLAVGAPGAHDLLGRAVGGIRVLSLATGRLGGACAGELEGGRFGDALTSGPRGDGLGPRRIFIGAPAGTLSGAPSPGFVFAWEPERASAVLFAKGSSPGDAFGAALSGGVDLDGDQAFELAIGAPQAHEGRGAFALYSEDATPICRGVGLTMNAHLGASVLLVSAGAEGAAGWVVTGSPGAVGNYFGPNAPAPSIQFGAGRVDLWSPSGALVASQSLSVGFSALGTSLACIRPTASDGKSQGASGPSVVASAPIEAADGVVRVLCVP